MGPTDSVLVVVDMQNGFVSSRSAPIVPRVVELVDRWAAAGLPYVMTRFHNSPGSSFESLIGWSRMQSAPESDIVDDLAHTVPNAWAVFDKQGYTSFTPEFSDLVREQGWRNIYVTGIATESCVLKTVVDAFEADLVPWLVTDASYSHAGEEPHQAGLLVAKRFIGRGQLITSDMALAKATERLSA